MTRTNYANPSRRDTSAIANIAKYRFDLKSVNLVLVSIVAKQLTERKKRALYKVQTFEVL